MTDIFMHAADLHLGAPFASLSDSLPEAKAANLRTLVAGVFDNLVETALLRGVSFVVLAGDIYDDAERETSAQFRFQRGLARLSDAGIHTFIVHGNHDPLSGVFRPVRPMPERVTVFEPGDVQEHVVPLRSGNDIRVAGVSYATQHETDNLALRFQRLEPRSDVATVGVMHANLSTASGHERYAEFSTDDLVAAPVDYWALGHVHARTVGSLINGARYAYPGNPQGRSSKPSECGPKGVLLVPVRGSRIEEPEFVECDTVRFARIRVDLGEATDLGDVVESIAQSSLDTAEESSGRPVLIHADLVGSTSVHRDVLGEGADKLRDLVRERLDGGLGDGELVRLRISTTDRVPRERLLNRGDLLSEVLRTLDRTGRGADEILSRVDSDLVGSMTLRRLREGLDGDDPQTTSSGLVERIWGRAEQMLIDALGEER